MRTSTIVWILIIIVVIGGGWYWWSMSSASMMAPSTTASTSVATSTGDGTGVSQNLTLGINNDPTLGAYLIAYNGMTVYTYKPDTAGVSNCTGTCAQTWPPYTVPAGTTLNPEAGVSGTLATITRADGTLQVTYNGMPLYFYSGDTAPNQTTGQGLGGVWYVATP